MPDPPLIEFLYWKECPSHAEAWTRLHRVLERSGVRADIHRIEVESEEQARRLGFPGSPTIRINGRDIDPQGAGGSRYGLTCRIYHDPAGRGIPLPTEELIQTALDALGGRGGAS